MGSFIDTVLTIVIVGIVVFYVGAGIICFISEMYEEKQAKKKQEKLRKLNEAQRRICSNESCQVCGRKLQNTYGYFVNRKSFYISPMYQKYCWATYMSLPASDEKNEFHTSFDGWREMQLMIGDFGAGNTVVICENCYKRT